MRLIDADGIKYTEQINGEITVSKEEIQKMPTILDYQNMIQDIKERLQERTEYYGDDENLDSKIYKEILGIIGDRIVEN
ncbi:hypothetical protein NSB25_27390 [Acetatifactor muris]|uniref:Uncharacterized protein n=1 Tax=Acetatifactor muris TaxID=879566 RepID=A0A2K4ZPR7_9FIRM|nr:hypothetical protein [Acetatifactor muris]MCR2050950.1 hypothetical protein [Acetatifactor muris]SOY32467.1 hypothetical protein AMURIS_05232 [Acetatifactor muris]